MSFNGLYQCDICSKDILVRLIPLVSHEKLLALKLIKSTKKYILFLREPRHACVPCFRKLYVFKACIEGVLIKRKINGNMQQPSTSKAEENLEEQSEESQKEEICLHDRTCECKSCQSKYGSLPLLLQGIAQKCKAEGNPREDKAQPSASASQDADLKTPKKVLVCQYCSKSFTHRGDYNKHQRKHTKEQPFSCQICKRKFGHSSNLRRHYRLHSGHRPFVCDICDKSFSRKDKLECHMKSKFCKKKQS